VDVLLLFGGSLPDAWDSAAALVDERRVGTLVLVGGEGHTSDVLRELLGASGGTEADLMAAYLEREHGITDVLLEPRSRNCGENVVLARDLVLGAGLSPRTVALVQDPTMQRRMDAVFRLAWPEATAVNRPGPRQGRHAWPRDRWVELVMGEVPRLRDDEHGYGPDGAGFQAHVDVPAEVEAAYAALRAAHPEWARPPR
jgi:uncharacterized SAM-binding protein YcdF (DUF218 family)